MKRDLSPYLKIQVGDSVACYWTDIKSIGIVTNIHPRATFPIEVSWMGRDDGVGSFYDKAEVVEMKYNYAQIKKEMGLTNEKAQD